MLTRRQMLVALTLVACNPRTSQPFTTPGSEASRRDVLPADLVVLALEQGLGSSFSMQLFDSGAFEFTIGGLVPSFLRQPEVGVWKGTDPSHTAALRRQLIDALQPAHSNCSQLPDSATLTIGRLRDGKYQSASYAPEKAPAAATAALQHALRLVNGPWRSARWRTVAGKLKPGGSRQELLVQLSNTGEMPVTIPSPMASWACRLDLSLDPNEDPAIYFHSKQLRVWAHPPIPGSWQTQRAAATLVTIPRASQVQLWITPRSPPSPGRYDAHVSLRLEAPLSSNDSRDIVQGTLYIGPVPFPA